MRIRPSYSGASDFLKVYKEIFTGEVHMTRLDRSRMYNLRCSQLPYCPRSVILNHLKYGGHRPMSMSMAYYTKVGTVVHEVMQSYLAASGRFLADYTCMVCHKKYPLSHTHECCGELTQYDEVNLDVGTKNGVLGIQGHIDGIFKDARGSYWIVDYKTTSLAGAPGKLRSPGEGYRRQVYAYALLLRKQYGIEVAGVMLVFIPRDNPANPTVWELPFTEREFAHAKKEIMHDRKLHQLTMAARTKEDISALADNRCGGEYCDVCSKSKPQFMALVARAKAMKNATLPIMSDKVRANGLPKRTKEA